MSGAALARREGEYAPWLQLEGESDRGFHAFEHFRDMGFKRTRDDAYRAHLESCTQKHPKGTEEAPGRWTQWMLANGWVERASAWDRELDGSKLEGVRLEVIEMGKRQAAQAARNLDVLDFPAKLITEILKRSPDLVARIAEMATTPAEEDGSNPPMGVSELMGILKLVKEAATALPALAKMEREALGVQDILEERTEEEEHTLKVTVEVVYDDTSPM